MHWAETLQHDNQLEGPQVHRSLQVAILLADVVADLGDGGQGWDKGKRGWLAIAPLAEVLHLGECC